jgi:hypothetical protein
MADTVGIRTPETFEYRINQSPVFQWLKPVHYSDGYSHLDTKPVIKWLSG